jgi:outer membrane lipoprotein LolB
VRTALAPLLGALVLGGCSSLPPAPLNSPESQQKWIERNDQLARLSTWRYSGRIALQVADEGWNANVVWSQFESVYEIELRGPFGAGAVSILGSPWGVQVRNGDEPPVLGENAQQLLHQRIGWLLPIESLEHWVLGRPDPGADSKYDIDPDGRLVRLSQFGWTVEYKSYLTATPGYELPRKIFARNENIGLRLVIDQWTLN